ncbi:MAG: TPM domain-containing protein [Lachnospiraceae bacterium]|nr:TPM domain-containing protein [Lachnospiraceae bacterium]
MKKISLMLVLCICILFTPKTVNAGNPGIYSTDVVTDEADLLTDAQEEELRERIEKIKAEHDFEVAIVTTTSLYGKGTAMRFTDDYYDYNNFDIDGICLMRCPETRDLYISTSGSGIDYFTDDDIDYALDEMVPYVSGGNFYKACNIFLDEVESNIEGYGAEKAMSYLMALGICALISLFVTFVTISGLKSNMNTAKLQTRGDNYVSKGSFAVTNARDIYLYSRVSVRPRVESSGSGGGRTSTHRGSSGRSHGGGGRKC